MNLDVWNISIPPIVDVFCAVVSVAGAIASWRYSVDVHGKLKNLSIREYCELFKDRGNNFINQTRKPNWYRGTDPSVIINPLSGIIKDFGRISGHLKNAEQLKQDISTIHDRIQRYGFEPNQTNEEKEKTNQLILDFSMKLGEASYSRFGI